MTLAILIIVSAQLALIVTAGVWGWVRFHRWNKAKKQIRTVLAAASKRRT